MHHSKLRIQITVFLLSVLSCGLALAANQVGLSVDSSVDPARLVVVGNELPCAPGEPLNCIEVAKGMSPHIFFNLPKACKQDGPQYRLTGFRITETDKVWPTPENPMTADIAKDFCADRNTGEVDLRYCNNQRKDDRLKIKNFNSFEATVYYEITAVTCADEQDAIYLDPQIKNRGTN